MLDARGRYKVKLINFTFFRYLNTHSRSTNCRTRHLAEHLQKSVAEYRKDLLFACACEYKKYLVSYYSDIPSFEIIKNYTGTSLKLESLSSLDSDDSN